MRRLRYLAAVLVAAGCSDLTNVAAPDVVQRGGLTGVTGATTLFNGGFNSFARSYASANYGGSSIVNWSGLISDELSDAGDFPSIDQRHMPDPDPQNGVLYDWLQQARANFLDAIQGFNVSAPPGPYALKGESYALIGYSELFFAELFCSGMPLSAVVNGQPVYGKQLTTDQMFAQALTDFDSAAVYSADSQPALQLVRIGRGRVLLDLARYTDADTAVAGIPTSFTVVIPYQDNVLSNGPYYEFINNLDVTISDREGGNGLNFISANDPRVPTYVAGTSRNGITIHALTTVASPSQPVVLATGIEAQLAHAEAQLQSGDITGWAATLNALRADSADTKVSGLTPLTPDSTTTAAAALRVDVMFRERAFWLYLSGHRLEDLRRLVRWYGRDVNTVFPVGIWQNGLPYGTDVNYAPAHDAYYNPNYHGCLDRKP